MAASSFAKILVAFLAVHSTSGFYLSGGNCCNCCDCCNCCCNCCNCCNCCPSQQQQALLILNTQSNSNSFSLPSASNCGTGNINTGGLVIPYWLGTASNYNGAIANSAANCGTTNSGCVPCTVCLPLSNTNTSKHK